MRLRVRASLRSRVGVRGRARVRASPLLPRVGWGGGGERRGGQHGPCCAAQLVDLVRHGGMAEATEHA